MSDKLKKIFNNLNIPNLNIIILERDLKNEDKGNIKGVLKLND